VTLLYGFRSLLPGPEIIRAFGAQGVGSLREAAWAQTAVVGVRGHGWAAARRPSSPASGNAQAMVDAVRKAFGNTC